MFYFSSSTDHAVARKFLANLAKATRERKMLARVKPANPGSIQLPGHQTLVIKQGHRRLTMCIPEKAGIVLLQVEREISPTETNPHTHWITVYDSSFNHRSWFFEIEKVISHLLVRDELYPLRIHHLNDVGEGEIGHIQVDAAHKLSDEDKWVFIAGSHTFEVHHDHIHCTFPHSGYTAVRDADGDWWFYRPDHKMHKLLELVPELVFA